jgi:hypothetical protein
MAWIRRLDPRKPALQNAGVLTAILVLLAIVAARTLIEVRRRQARLRLGGLGTTPALLERTLKDVRSNDIVQHEGRDYLVEGVIAYDEDGHHWSAARLVDGKDERWLLVGLERGGAPTLRLLSMAKGFDLAGYPPETLDLGDAHWRLASRGTANATFQGDLNGLHGDGAGQRCRWWKYTGAGEAVLYVEQWGDTYRALRGSTVRDSELELLAAS